MLYVYRMEYCAALKKNEILLPATIGMNLQSIMLSEICQPQKVKLWFYYYEVYKVIKITETENRKVVA